MQMVELTGDFNPAPLTKTNASKTNHIPKDKGRHIDAVVIDLQ